MFTALDTGISKVKNVAQFIIGDGSLKKLGDELLPLRSIERSSVLFFVDHFFSNVPEFIGRLPVENHDAIFFIDTTTEPTTEQVDDIVQKSAMNLKISRFVLWGLVVGPRWNC